MSNKIKMGIFSLSFLAFLVASAGLASAQTACYFTTSGQQICAVTDTGLYQGASGVIQQNTVNSLAGLSNFGADLVLAIGVLIVLAVLYIFVVKIILPFFQR